MPATRIQPQDEIGPNNAGKMIIRGICLVCDYANHPALNRRVMLYLSARGTVSDIDLPPQRANAIKLSQVEIQFINTLIDGFMLREIRGVGGVEADETGDERDAVVCFAREMIKNEGAYIPNIKLQAGTITENVALRKAVSYQDTQDWKKTGGQDSDDESEQVSRGYVPPTYR